MLFRYYNVLSCFLLSVMLSEFFFLFATTSAVVILLIVLILISTKILSTVENYPVGSSEVKSESVSSLQPQASVSSLPSSSPGPKRSGTTGNTLKKWLTSPVRRLSHGKGDNANAKKPNNKQRKRDGRKSVDLGAQHEDSAEEVGGRSQGKLWEGF